MKRLLFILPLLMLLTACGGDDDSNSNTSLVGKWTLIKADYYEDDVLDYSETITPDETCPDYIEFTNENIFQSIVFDEDCTSDIDEAGVYNYSGNTLTTTSFGETFELTITTLTDTQLVVEDIYNESGISYRDVATFLRIE